MAFRGGGKRGPRRGGRGGPSLSDVDDAWRSPTVPSQVPQQVWKNHGRGRGVPRPLDKNFKGQPTFDPTDLLRAEQLFSSFNKDVKIALESHSLKGVDRILSESIRRVDGLTISWSNSLEDFVLFLKHLLVSRDGRFVSLHYFEPSELSIDSEFGKNFPQRACRLLQIISDGLISGKDAYSLLHFLVSKTSTNSYTLPQLFGLKGTSTTMEELTFNPSLPYKSILDVITCLITKSKEVLSFAERKALFSDIGGGTYTSFSQDMACILSDLIHLAMKLITSNKEMNSDNNNIQEFTNGVEKVLLLELVKATPFDRLPSSLLHTMCLFLDDLYRSAGNNQLCNLSRSILSILMQTEGLHLENLKSIFETREIPLNNPEIRSAFGNGVVSVVGSSIVFEFLNNLSTIFEKLDCPDNSIEKFVIESSSIVEHMEIFIGLAKYHFIESLTTCQQIFRITIPILVRAGLVEQKIRNTGFLGSLLEEKLGGCLPGVTLKFLINFLSGVSDYVKGEFDEEYVTAVGEIWFSILQIFPEILKLGSWTLGCFAFDAMSVVNEEFFSQLSVEAQEQTLAFVVKVGADDKHRPEILAKSGRCLALMFDYQMLVEQSEPLWFTLNCIGRSLHSEHLQVRTSWAWALGKWSDALEKHHTNGEMPNDLENSVLHVLKLIHICSKDVIKMRYNGYRTAANVFKWLPDAALEYPTVKKEISNTTDILISQIGHGIDYKARWNAVYAVGCIFENSSIMSEMDSSILGKTLSCLWTWVAQSQNYKERIQCAVALRKIQSRGFFKDNYHTVWYRVCLSVTRLPVEDIDLAQKLKCEVVITLAELTSLMEPNDLSGLETILTEHGESLKTLFLDTNDMIPIERREIINRARDRVMSLRRHQNCDNVIDCLCEIFCDYSQSEDSLSCAS